MCCSLERMLSACWRPLSRYARMNKDEDDSSAGESDKLMWCKDLEKHSCGEFSFAVVQANEVLEDQSQVETGQNATFIGVYDGHGGSDASEYISNHLFVHLIRFAQENGTISEGILRNAFSATEDGFLTLVRRSYELKPKIASIGSCCLVGVIWHRTLYVANLGDSRAVLGYIGRSNKIFAEQLTKDHNASMEEVRQELKSLHPDDAHVVVLKNGVWRIKGIIQVSRSIGDAYLKRPEFPLDPSFQRFMLREPLRRPVLRADPSTSTRILQPSDKFIIFASDGLWEHLSNQQAVEIVNNNPRNGIARRLVQAALSEAARKIDMKYKELKEIGKGKRRSIHDDITVVVFFIDHDTLEENDGVHGLSVRGFVDTVGPSKFNILPATDQNA